MSNPTDTVRCFYDALGRGDVPAVLALLDSHVQWTEAESFPYYSGTWTGPDAVANNLLIPLAVTGKASLQAPMSSSLPATG